MEFAAGWLPVLLAVAVLLPLASFVAILLFGPQMGIAGELGAHVATGAILSSLVLSLIALGVWVSIPTHDSQVGDSVDDAVSR